MVPSQALAGPLMQPGVAGLAVFTLTVRQVLLHVPQALTAFTQMLPLPPPSPHIPLPLLKHTLMLLVVELPVAPLGNVHT